VNRKRILLNLLIVSILLFSLYSLSVYGTQARGYVYSFLGNSQKAVAGATSNVADAGTVSVNEVSLPAFSQKLQTDVVSQIEAAKNFGLTLSIGEIIEMVSRVQKVSEDARGVKGILNDKLRELAGK